MTSNCEQLAILGQQVLDAVIATYNPSHDPSLALSLHPGQPLADDLVQNGVTNSLRLSEWLEDQYDYPLWLKRSDASSISASSVGSLSAKSAYLAMIPWAQPSIPPDVPAFSRISGMIADARKDIGDNPDALPFSCEPGNFAEAGSTAWHVFDQRISSNTATTTTTESGPVRVNPQLWKMRAVTPDIIDRLATVSDAARQRRALTAELAAAPRAEAITKMRALSQTPVVSTRMAAMASRNVAQPFRIDAISRAAPATQRFNIARAVGPARLGSFSKPVKTRLSPQIAPKRDQLAHTIRFDRLATIQMHDLETAPVVQEVTTTGSELHVHFEYCMLTITRRIAGKPWWHAELLNEDDWYVPGMKRGDMVAASTDDAYARCLPQALLLVRNVTFTGTWTADAKNSLTGEVSFLGPFLMRAATTAETSAAAGEEVSILGAGIQVIGELCCLLPPLPPQDEPVP